MKRDVIIVLLFITGLISSFIIQAETYLNDGKNIQATRIEQPPTIDGDIDEPCWQKAPKATGFVDPLSGNLAKDQTIGFLLYDDNAIYVAVHALDSQPEKITARQMKDQTFIRGEDYVSFSIDPFHTHQMADRNFFMANALGTKYAYLAAGRAEKPEWLGLWKAAAQRTDDGWTLEMEIPWQMLVYPTVKKPITMGINFDRYQHRTGEQSWWSSAGTQTSYEYDGHWVDVMPPAKHRELKLLPYTYLGLKEANPGYDNSARAGMDVRYAVTPQMMLVGTINPDFENVELAVEGIDFSYGARYVPDYRPFFQEGRNVFRLDRFYHSRQISDVDAGLSLFGKVGRSTTVGALSTFRYDGDQNIILRTFHSPSANTSFGVAYLGRHMNDSSANSIMFFDGGKWSGIFSAGVQFAQALDGTKLIGRQMWLPMAYNGSRFNAGITTFFIDPDFVNELGFHPFVGIRGGEASVQMRNEWRSGFLRRSRLFTSAAVSDDYDGKLFRRTAMASGILETHSDYSVSLRWDGGRFGEYQDGVFIMSLMGRASDRFTNYGVSYSWGTRREERYRSIQIQGNLQVEALTTGLILHFVKHIKRNEQHILTFNYDFTRALSIGGRLIWQNSDRNVYFVLRRSGYAGTDIYIIVGNPNAQRFQRRIIGKVVIAF